MLQMMQQRVLSEGEKAQQLFDKYMCYCEASTATLKKSIAAAETRLPELESGIKELSAETDRLKSDVEQANVDRDDARGGLRQSKDLAIKEQDSLSKELTDGMANIQALDKAIGALEKGLSGGSFLQSRAASSLRQLSVSLDMSSGDRDVLASFLSADETYKPSSSEVLGILRQMRDEIEGNMESLKQSLNTSVTESKAIAKAKRGQIAALTKQIESKSARAGEVAVDSANMQGDFDDTTKALQEDRTFLADLEKSCSEKKADWAVHEGLRAEELQAISSTIKLLNDDEALNLFKKTLPSPAFVQLASVQQRALRALDGRHSTRLQAVSSALRSRRTSFDKIIKMIDEMVALLRKEETDDEERRAYCNKELASSEEEVRQLDLDVSDLGKAVEEAKQKVASLTEDVAALGKAIQQLDKQVEESTTQRKEEHAEFVEALGMNSATKELLEKAKGILNKFYNARAAEADDSAAFAQLPSLPPEPEGFGTYEPQHEGHGSVVAMINTLMEDCSKDSQALEVAETHAQAKYEKAMTDAAAKRASDAKMVAEKEGVKAEYEARLHKLGQERKAKRKESKSEKEYIKDLHGECDWLLANFDVRREARDGEVESLHQAKAVLSGADYSSLAQKSRGA